MQGTAPSTPRIPPPYRRPYRKGELHIKSNKVRYVRRDGSKLPPYICLMVSITLLE